MFRTVDMGIAPNDKYDRVLGLHEPAQDEDTDVSEASETDDWEDWPDDHKQAADAYVETMADAPTAADYEEDPDDMDTLTWGMISTSSDPDLLSKIATYFEGMEPDEPTDLLRAKCRLLDVDVYANAQIAARQELRGK